MKTYYKKLSFKVLSVLASMTSTQFALAADTYSIGTAGGSAFDKITHLLQDWVDFMGGPMGKFVVIFGLIGGVCIWVALPKQGVLAVVGRVIVAGAVLLNTGVWMTWMGG